MSPDDRAPAAILDIDGTLIDSVYQRALAWHRAFRLHGHHVPAWRVHRSIGMGGDELIGALLGEEIRERQGEAIKAAEKGLYAALLDEVAPLPGAHELLQDLRDRGNRTVLASSARPDEVDHYIDLLEARDLVDAWTTGGDVEHAKPEPDLVVAALEKVGGGPAVMIGDSTWDCEAAGRVGVRSIGVLTGGFCRSELISAGAELVYESLDELRADLGAAMLARS
jgi:HAD superfamily hydrolase (TIGR01509 family)